MSKSVRLRSIAAATGRKKNTPMSTSAGARKSHAAFVPSAGRRAGRTGALTPVSSRSRFPCLLRLPGHPATLLEQPVHVAIERRERAVHRHAPADRLLAVLEHLRGDLFPLRHLRERHHSLELFAERACITIVCERGVGPRGARWRE